MTRNKSDKSGNHCFYKTTANATNETNNSNLSHSQYSPTNNFQFSILNLIKEDKIMKLTYEQLKETVDNGGVKAGVELILFTLLATNTIKLTDKGKREMAEVLIEYCEKTYGFPAEMLILFGLQKQDWLMELIREAIVSDEMMDKLGIDKNS